MIYFTKQKALFLIHAIYECSYLNVQGLAESYPKKPILNQRNNSAGLKSSLTDATTKCFETV